MSARPAAALLVCALLLPSLWLLPAPSDAVRATLKAFSDGANSTAVVFGSPGTNSSVTFTLPKAADVTRATIDIEGAPYLENWSIGADTRVQFAAMTVSNLDLNTTPGEVILQKEFFATDEFGNASLDSRWAWLNSPSSWDLGVTRPGWLHMVSPRGTNFNGTLDNGALVYQTLRGNFTLETKVNCTPQWDWQKSGIMVRQDKDNWVALKYQNQTGKRVQWSVMSNGNMWSDVSSGGMSATQVWLRLVREGSRWISLFSTNGVAWTQLWDTNLGTAKALNDPVSAGLLVADGGTWAYWPADYDYFNFSRYLTAGSILSGALSTPRPVTQARMTWSGLTAMNTANTVLSVRASASSPWERLMPNQTTKLINPGQSPQVLVQITSSGIPTPVLYEFQVNFSTLLYPSGLSLALGTGAPFWTNAGELNGIASAEFRQSLSDYLASATADGNGNVTVPLTLASQTRGAPILRNLVVEYSLGAPPAAPAPDSPAQGGFVASQNPELWLNGTDPDGDPLWYCVEISGDGFVTKTVYNQSASPMGWSRLGSPYPSGERALLTVAVPLAQGRTYAWRARSFDGSYWGPFSDQRDFTVDITAPEGSVSAEGRFTANPAGANATLSFSDGESGVAGYEYMIGTRPEMDNVFPATATVNTSIAAGGLSLQQGVNYYFSARAQNRAGSWSGWASSDPFQYWPASVAPSGIEITRPAACETVSGIIQIAGTAWLRDGWTKNNTVQYRLDDEPWKFITPRGLNQTRDWSVERDTRALLDGDHVVSARLISGLVNSTEIAIAESRVWVWNNVGPPPLEATFTPSGDATLTIDENERLEFAVVSTNQNLTIQWNVDGLPRQGETFAKYDFRPGYTMAGRHNVSVTVSAGNQTLWRSWNVTVRNVDRPPSAGILNPPPGTHWLVGDNISFNASTTTDPDADDALRYLWDLGDGTQMEGLEVVHAYLAAGTYRVTLTVTDGTLQSQARVNLTVTVPTKVIHTGGSAGFPYMLLVLAPAAVAAAAGAVMFVRRRGAATAKPGPQKLYRLPAPVLVDVDEEAPKVRETSSTDWKRLERDARERPPASAPAYPEYRPSGAPRPAPPPQAHATFTPPPRRTPLQTAPTRPSARPPPMAVPPPAEAFENIPEVEVIPMDEAIPEAPAEAVPAARHRVQGAGGRVQGTDHGAAPARHPAPGTQHPAAGPRHPAPRTQHPAQKPADTMDELLARLEKNRRG